MRRHMQLISETLLARDNAPLAFGHLSCYLYNMPGLTLNMR
jgi:hypothetical protein